MKQVQNSIMHLDFGKHLIAPAAIALNNSKQTKDLLKSLFGWPGLKCDKSPLSHAYILY